MVKFPGRAFLNDRLTFRLSVLAEEAISANDGIFVEKTGCTIREIRVLRLIDDYPGITFIEINKATGLERSLTSRIIRSLLAAGLAKREGVESDARKYGLSTTALGKRKRLEARELSDQLEAVLLKPLTVSELENMTGMLDRLAAWVRAPEYAAALDAHRAKPRRKSKAAKTK